MGMGARRHPKLVSLASHCFDARRETRHLAADGVLVEHALGHAAHQFGLCRLQRFGRTTLVATCDGLFDPPQVRPDPRFPRFVHQRPPNRLACAFLRSRRIGHIGFRFSYSTAIRSAVATIAHPHCQWTELTVRGILVTVFQKTRPCPRIGLLWQRANGKDGVQKGCLRAVSFHRHG